jgi:hypothetical protein
MLALLLELLTTLLPFLKDGTNELGKMVVAVLRRHRETLDTVAPGLMTEIDDAYASHDPSRISQLRARLYQLAGADPAIEPGGDIRYEDRPLPREPA